MGLVLSHLFDPKVLDGHELERNLKTLLERNTSGWFRQEWTIFAWAERRGLSKGKTPLWLR